MVGLVELPLAHVGLEHHHQRPHLALSCFNVCRGRYIRGEARLQDGSRALKLPATPFQPRKKSTNALAECPTHYSINPHHLQHRTLNTTRIHRRRYTVHDACATQTIIIGAAKALRFTSKSSESATKADNSMLTSRQMNLASFPRTGTGAFVKVRDSTHRLHLTHHGLGRLSRRQPSRLLEAHVHLEAGRDVGEFHQRHLRRLDHGHFAHLFGPAETEGGRGGILLAWLLQYSVDFGLGGERTHMRRGWRDRYRQKAVRQAGKNTT